MKYKPWTEREVRFEVYPRTADEKYDALMDAAVDRYWETWRHNRLLGTLSIGHCERTFIIGGWPWWVPKACARRSVANLAASVGVGGDAEYHTFRAVLVV